MGTPVEASVERFRRRMERTDEGTVRRNLRAGVYGPPGSPRRAAVELAVQSSLAERAQAAALVSRSEREVLEARVEGAERAARRALWVAALAVLTALLAVARSYALS